ncbi:MAG: response regulator [Clostridiaceae bacterium]|jgi:two-component system response regulator YesN|nr:response regulator [Clostridiaceae bacterium]
MLKIFLVEDEYVVREGIKNNIDWAKEGFIFSGEAADGELAFPLIQAEQPDIIITDIKMPFMNGLDLSRLVVKALPQSKIIILSGHEEFSYAQEAIKIGVTEYLLKPIKSTELIETVKRIGKQIIAEREERENYERYKREMEENETEKMRRLFNEMITGTLSIAKILERGKEYGIELSAKLYQIILFKYNIKNKDEIYSREILELEKEINSVNSRYDNIIMFDRAIEGIAFLIKGDSSGHLDSTREAFISRLKDVMEKYPHIRYFGGIGIQVDRLTALSQSYESAARAFSYRFIFENNDIISSNQVLSFYRQDEDDTVLSEIELESLDLKKADAFLKSGEAEEITYFVEEFLKSVGSASEKSFLFKQYIIMNIYFTVVAFLKEIGSPDLSIEEPFKGLEGIKEMYYDNQKAKDYIIRIFSAAIERRDALRNKRYHRIIDQAKEYINRHFADEDISLYETAAYVNLSPSHFSSVFSKETGKSFIRYLTDLRMSKAREMLKCTDMRCSDISIAVGYKDAHYFSYLFKKIHNCSPMQYRTSKE